MRHYIPFPVMSHSLSLSKKKLDVVYESCNCRPVFILQCCRFQHDLTISLENNLPKTHLITNLHHLLQRHSFCNDWLSSWVLRDPKRCQSFPIRISHKTSKAGDVLSLINPNVPNKFQPIAGLHRICMSPL